MTISASSWRCFDGNLPESFRVGTHILCVRVPEKKIFGVPEKNQISQNTDGYCSKPWGTFFMSVEIAPTKEDHLGVTREEIAARGNRADLLRILHVYKRIVMSKGVVEACRQAQDVLARDATMSGIREARVIFAQNDALQIEPPLRERS
jgi:hypothetical protein